MTTIRLFSAADLPRIQAVRAAVRVVKPDVWMPGPDTDTDPAHLRYCLLAEVDNEPVGYGWMDWWTEDDGTRLLLLLGFVDPGWRRRGIGRVLLAAQEHAAMPVAASLDGPAPVLFGANADEDQPDARRLLLRCGFGSAFTVVDLECDLAEVGPMPVPLPDGFAERPIVEADHVRIHDAIEESFAGATHGYVGRTYEQYRRDVAERQADTGLWCVAWDGDEVAAVVINERLDERAGNTTWVAVREPWRRRGLATATVRIGLARCAAAGLSTMKVSTISENANRTVALYESTGYRVVRRMPRYRKPVSPIGKAREELPPRVRQPAPPSRTDYIRRKPSDIVSTCIQPDRR